MGAETANSVLDILRGTAPDAYGDIADDMAPYQQGVPATLIETTQAVSDPGTQVPRIVRSVTALVPSWTGTVTTDQVRDQYGNVFMVEDVVRQPSLTGAPADLKLILRRVSASGP